MKPITPNQRDYLAMQTRTDEELQEITDRARREGNIWALFAGLFILVGVLAALRLSLT